MTFRPQIQIRVFLNPVDGSDEMTRKIGQKGPSTVFFSARPFQLRHVSVNDGAINNKKKTEEN